MSTYDSEVPDQSEQLDLKQPDDSLLDRGVDDVLDEGYSPPENYSTLERVGEHETLDQRLAEEEPEQYDSESLDDDDVVGEGEFDEEFLDDGEVGDRRAGRLVDPGGGSGEDTESAMWAEDVGIDGGAASAEEAAVHVISDDRLVADE